MGRKILLVTTDQQRYDTLACNGGTLSRTPVVDGLAAEGVRYERAHPQSVVCMPSRSTILTGQHPSTHGVWMNGVPLPGDAPSVAEVLRQRGLPHRPGRQGPLRALLRPVPPLRGERCCRPRAPRPTAARAAASSTSRRPPTGPWDRSTTRQWLDAGTIPRRSACTAGPSTTRCRSAPSPAATPARPRSRSTRSTAGSTTPTGWPTGPSPGSTRSTPTTTGSAG